MCKRYKITQVNASTCFKKSIVNTVELDVDNVNKFINLIKCNSMWSMMKLIKTTLWTDLCLILNNTQYIHKETLQSHSWLINYLSWK